MISNITHTRRQNRLWRWRENCGRDWGSMRPRSRIPFWHCCTSMACYYDPIRRILMGWKPWPVSPTTNSSNVTGISGRHRVRCVGSRTMGTSVKTPWSSSIGSHCVPTRHGVVRTARRRVRGGVRSNRYVGVCGVVSCTSTLERERFDAARYRTLRLYLMSLP